MKRPNPETSVDYEAAIEHYSRYLESQLKEVEHKKNMYKLAQKHANIACDKAESQLKEAEQVIKTISELNHWDNTVSEMRELADTYLKIHNQPKEDES